MSSLSLHHTSIPVRDLDRAIAFYEGVLGLTPLPRPGFPFSGRWYGTADRQVHLIVNTDGTFRETTGPAPRDAHVALATEQFEAMLETLVDQGFSESAPRDDPMHVAVKRGGATGWDQMFLCDPDGHTIEINNAPIVGR